MKARIALTIAIALFAVTFAQAADDLPQPTAGHTKMLDWCGEYTITGKTFTTPLEPGREIKGRWIGKPILGGFAIEGNYFYEGKGPTGETQAREVCSYDADTNTYHYVFLSNNGYREQAPVTVDGPVAAWEGTQMIDGKKYWFRGRDRDLPDGSGFVRTAELSADGVTWQPLIECRHIKVKTPSDEQELIRCQHEWSRVEVAGDVRALDRLLADEYVLTLSDGTALPKAAYLRDVQSEDTRSTAMAVESPTVRLYGDMALVKGIVKWTEPSGMRHEELFHETWLKRDGRWQCLATHESGGQEIAPGQELRPGYEKLARLVGDWTYEGHSPSQWKDTPYGPAGKFSGQFSSRFVLDGSFVQERWQEKYEGGETLSGINIFRYDPEQQNVVVSAFGSDGSTYSSVYTIEGDTMRTRFRQISAEGDPFRVKAVWKYGPGLDTFKATWQISLDEGKTWKPWITYDGTKRKD